jgi:hypothetical protein
MIIYKLTSPSNKSYIGQTKSNIELRWKQHRQLWKRLKIKGCYKNSSSKLFYAFDKYPENSCWKISILCECLSKKELDKMEMYYILNYDTVNNGYNITKGGSGRKVDFLTKEHKQNLSNARKKYYDTQDGKKWKQHLSIIVSGKNNPRYGKTFSHSDKTKQDISNKMKGKNKGKEPWNKDKQGVYSEKTLEKMSKNRTGKALGKDNSKNMKGKSQTDFQKEKSSIANSKFWIITDPNGNQFEIFNLRKYCKENGLDASNIQTKCGSKKQIKESILKNVIQKKK